MNSLGEFARRQARRFGDKPLFLAGDESLTYRGYDERSDRLAGGLKVYMVDRLKHMIICGGYNIYPKEIENVLHGHPAVLECAVIGVPDAVKGEIPKACVVLKPGARATEPDIKEFCRQALAAYKVPRLVEFMASLPKTATGKIRKGELATSASR